VAVFGAFGMAIAIVLGVWLSIRISLEDEAKAHPSFTWWVVNRLAFLVGVTNIAGFVVFFLQEKFSDLAGEKAAGPASRIMMFVGIFILLTVLPSGWLADRYGKKRLLYISNVLAIAGTAIIVIAPTLSLIYVGGCIIGMAAGLF
jgi:MFS family permease